MPRLKGSIPWNKGLTRNDPRIAKMGFGGKHHTEEAKRRISEKLKGRPKPEHIRKILMEANKNRVFTEEHRKKLSINHPKKLSEEHKRKISEARIGIKRTPFSDEAKRNMGNSHKGVKFSMDIRRKMSEAQKKSYITNRQHPFGQLNPNYGKVTSPKIREKISQSLTGANHPNWRGGSSFLPYNSEFNRKLKKIITQRDKNNCYFCGNIGNQVHHIDYDKNNNEYVNLITLCKSCHMKTNNHHREPWRIFFQTLQQIRGVS